MKCLYERSTRFRTARRSSVVSSRSRDDSAALSSPSAAPAQRRVDNAAVASAPGEPGSVEAENGVQPIRPGSSDFYFSMAQQLLTQSNPVHCQGDGSTATTKHAPRSARDLQRLIDGRSVRRSQPLLSIIPLPRWLEILDAYEDEIGLLYPFLDVTELRNQLRDSSAHTLQQGAKQQMRVREKLEEILILVLAVMAVLEEPDISRSSDEFTEQVMAGTWRRVHTGDVTDHDVNLSILMVRCFFGCRDRSVYTGF
jgi:hypothetical protein